MLDPHPLAEAVPDMSEEEYAALVEDIAQYGLREPIVVYDGMILDGRHRYRAMRELAEKGLAPEPHFESFEGTEEEARAFVVGLNLHRRHLGPEQWIALQTKIKQDKELQRTTAVELRQRGHTQAETAAIVGVTQQTVDLWESADESNTISGNPFVPPDLRISIPRREYTQVATRREAGESCERIAADYKVTPQRISQICTLVEAQSSKPEYSTPDSPLPDRKYRCIVIDPPWPVAKIQREQRPNQVHMDYPTMTLGEIGDLPIGDLADESGCHLYLWVTHKHLPDGLELVEGWGFAYQCLLTWVKPTAMTPFSWMYNTEHVIFAHIGNLPLQKLGLKLSFEVAATKHSAKPDLFYQRVAEASPEPRLDMFARGKHDGYSCWGYEAPNQMD